MSSPSSSDASNSSSGTQLSSTSSLRAQQHQVRGLQSYLLSCQPFFEKLLTELLLHQPKDPAEFITKAISSVPASERADLIRKLQNNEDIKANHEDPDHERAKASVHVILTLVLNEGDEYLAQAISALKDLQAYARSTVACLKYDILHGAGSSEIVVVQHWATQTALSEYYNSPAFTQVTPKFQGILAQPPDERVYKSV